MSQPESIEFDWNNLGKEQAAPVAKSMQNDNDVSDELSALFGEPPAVERVIETNAAKPPLTLRINDKKTLHQMWMPIFKHGGFFIPKEQLANKEYAVGETFSFKVSLPDDPAVFTVVSVKMAWETPKFAEHRLLAGLGFAFESSDAAFQIKQRAERLLTDVPPTIANYTI
jgi:Tfp pilus assembly protein PilZ